ncbi:hypothetical protein [Rhodobacter sp. CZR27]|uniref:hypothetical protein n=1 Tax=Rhodobacter sp. CZR27 TaxID=2033869 RepID=UPI000BBEA39F|nr:hypothetical protein [Rhodobacter sp. CZR27]
MHLPAAALVITFLPAAAAAADLIECTREGKPVIRIKLNGGNFDGHQLACIEGEFVADIDTVCAQRVVVSILSNGTREHQQGC